MSDKYSGNLLADGPKYLRLFYSVLRSGLFIFVILAFVAAIAEAFTISMLIPVLGALIGGAEESGFAEKIHSIYRFLRIEPTIGNLFIGITIIGILSTVLQLVVIIARCWLMNQTNFRLRKRFFTLLSKADFQKANNIGTGVLNNLITTETGGFTSAVYHFAGLISSLILGMTFLLLGAGMNWPLMIGVGIFGILLFPILKGISSRRQKRSILFTEENAKMQGLSIESLTYYKYFRATALFPRLLNRLVLSFARLKRLTLFNQITSHGIAQTLRMIQFLLVITFLFVTAVIQKQAVSEVLALALVLFRGFQEIAKSQETWQLFLSVAGSVQAVDRGIANLESIKEQSGDVFPTFNELLELKEVSVHYGENKALNGISVKIEPNQTVAFVGKSGAGKSTLVDVLCGLIDPNEGTVTIDGVAYSNLDREQLRSMLGYVTQEPVVLDETLANNVTLWDPAAAGNDKPVLTALERAAALDFIQEREGALNSRAGERGNKLSGGQRQRLSIARELYRKPKILIFDEATSSLDAESSRTVLNTINSLRGQQTMVIISHQVESLRNCDRIYVLENGAVVTNGTWDELVKEDHPVFRKLRVEEE